MNAAGMLLTMSPRTGDQSPTKIGERLRLTREAMSMTQVAFCTKAGLSPSAYNQFEKGGTRPSVDAAIALVKAHRLTLDWIYLGDASGLKVALGDAIKTLRQFRS